MTKFLTMSLTAALTFVACATSPLGRRQLVLMPEGQMGAMGAQAFDSMKSQGKVDNDPRTLQYVRCVAVPLTEVSKGRENSPKDWEIVVFRDDTANAFALPGGKIGVHTGLLKVAKNEAQLAAVIGHEIGHVLARHGNERVSESLGTQLAMVGLAELTKNEAGQNSQLLMAALGLGAQVGLLLPHSRTQESEADIIGLDLMTLAGFDPSQAVELWKNMAAAGGGAPPEFLSTHPANQTRINNLSANIPRFQPQYSRAVESGRAPRCVR